MPRDGCCQESGHKSLHFGSVQEDSKISSYLLKIIAKQLEFAQRLHFRTIPGFRQAQTK